MKSTLKKYDKIKDFGKYPFLVESLTTNLVVLAFEDYPLNRFGGTIIYSEDPNEEKIGEYQTLWLKESFKPFKGCLMLEND